MDLFEMVESRRFLGADFLLWLWYRDDVSAGAFVVADEHLELHYDDQLVLEAELAEAEQSQIRGGAPAFAPEARKALQMGKRVARAKLRLEKGPRLWIFSVSAETFRLSGIRIPTPQSEGEEEKFVERMYLIEELEAAWQDIYRQFLVLRLSDAWAKEEAEIAAWIRTPTLGDPDA